jgi:aspartate racemase
MGGLSFGGIIAYEMAQQLMAQGQKVALLALLDTYLIDAKRPLPIHERIRYHLRQTLKLGPAYVLKQVQQKSQKLKEKVMRIYGKFYLEQGNTAPHALEYFARREISDQAHRDYVPQVYPGRVILFKATDRAEAATFYFDPDLGWGKLAAGGLDIYEVPGNHLSILKEPHVRVLGEKLRDCLDKEQVADGTDQKHQLRETSIPSS